MFCRLLQGFGCDSFCLLGRHQGLICPTWYAANLSHCCYFDRCLALVSHPDTAGPEVVNAKEEFHAISTAYKVLTKPELKKKYDAARQQHLGGDAAKSGFVMRDPRNLDVNAGSVNMAFSVASHELKHEGLLRNINTGSDWTELQDKYRNEKWHKLSVETKKVCDSTWSFVSK